jgi:general secretion pathway protein G
MERNTMNGEELRKKAKGKRQKVSRESVSPFSFFLFPFSFPRASRGFTLLELMIVISIIVILATVALPQYQKATRHARETVLRDDLFQMRKLVDQYAADKGKLPASLDELVTAGYMREIPEDPMTGETNWMLETGDDPSSLEGGTGITNIRSASTDTASDGRPYSEW